MAEEFPKTYQKSVEMQGLKKRTSSNHEDRNFAKRYKKGKPIVLEPPPSSLLLCTNLACGSTRPRESDFCKRCSCCVCKKYDDNKDSSLWMECSSESGSDDSCGFSCHIECALKRGCVSQLNGSYSCAWNSCNKTYSIIGYWKKQIVIAKEAKFVDEICYRILLSYRLLDGTLKFRELHKVIQELKKLLENELNTPIYWATMMTGEVEKTSLAARKVKQLCSLAIENADKLLKAESSLIPCSSIGGAARDFIQPEVQLGIMLPKSHLDLNIAPITDLNEEPREYDTKKKSDLGENYVKVEKTVWELEKEGHISEKFRLRFLTWFRLRAGEQERRTVYAFEQVMGDEPNALAGQLIHTFSCVIGQND